ncbi:hypothetical protein B566_EDAN007439 [Ephemera danica]|nr:hypothetical protein B566_EDAN007439 [Ephemera danica]
MVDKIVAPKSQLRAAARVGDMLGPEFVLLVPRRGAARDKLSPWQRVTEMLNQCAKHLIFALMWLVGIMFAGVVRVLNLRPSKRLPRIRNPLLLHSATHLAHMIRNRQVTSEEVVRAYISRGRDVEPQLNCVVDERYEAALLEACEVDALIASGTRTPEQMERETPFLGVPISVKESIAVQGMSHTAGQKLPEPRIAEKDAETVRLMRQAGAIPLVVTNTPELCMCYETDNRNTGRTNNPYDLRRTPGGSSGGEVSNYKSFMVPIVDGDL